MQIELRDITPAEAKAMLEANTHNRPIREKYVSALAREMTEGRWFPNGATYKICSDRRVIDGQHRLAAAVLADHTLVNVILVTDLPMEAQATTDIGKGRTSADNLSLSGYKNAAVLASVARRAWQWDRNNVKFHSSLTPTHTEIAAFVEANHRIHRSAEIASATRSTFKAVRQAVTGTAHFILTDIDQSDSAEFFARLAHGAALSSGHPILALRQRFMNDSAMRKTNPFHQDMALIFRSWNALREDRSLLKVQHGPDDPMIFPV